MTKNRNLLDVEESEQLMNHYKEEMAHEFGIHQAVQESDAKAKDMTKNVQKKEKSKENDRRHNPR